MKYVLFLILFLFIPHISFGAVAFGNSQANSLGTAGTSFSTSFTNTAGNYMVLVLDNRLTTGGCTTFDIDNLSVTYNGVALSFIKGTATDGVAGGSGTCVFGHLLELVSPATGVNTLSLSWTGTANISYTVMTFTGYGSRGTVLETNSTGNFSLSPTITTGDLVFGGLAVADSASAFACLDSNAIETDDGAGNTGSCGNTNTGTGAVNVHGTYGAFRRIYWAVPILQAVPVVSNVTNRIMSGDMQLSGDIIITN